MIRFSAPWDRGVRVRTALGLVLLGAFQAVLLVEIAARDLAPPAMAAGLASALVVPISVALAWNLRVRGYAIEGGALRIERNLRPVAVPLASVRAVGFLAERMRWPLRMSATGGVFGYQGGRFRVPGLGVGRLHCNRADGVVFVDTADERFVLSPEDPERFVAEVQASLTRRPPHP